MDVVRTFEPVSRSYPMAVRTGVPVTRTPDVPGERVVYGPERFEPSGSAPSRRANKNRSGRAGRKAYNGRKWAGAVGGTTDTMRAIYAPADKDMCRTVDPRTGYRDGVPFRSPR